MIIIIRSQSLAYGHYFFLFELTWDDHIDSTGQQKGSKHNKPGTWQTE